MPWLSFTYLVMRIDVGNISNAAIMNIEANHGIKQELHLSAQQVRSLYPLAMYVADVLV